MTVVVLTVDQRGSRTATGPGARRARRPRRRAAAAARFERTVGDEFQGVLDDPRRPRPARVERCCATAPGTSASASAPSTSRCPTHARAGRGPAYVHARTAVTAAKNSPWHLRVVGDDPAARALETTLWLWAAVLARRTDRGWEVADLVDQGLSYDEVGERLGISQSAVSQRAQAAGIVEGRRARELVTELAATCSGRTADVNAENWRTQLVSCCSARLRRRSSAAGPVRHARSGPPSRWPLLASRPGIVAAASDELDAVDRARSATLVVVLAGALAVAGGGPVTTAVFDLVDRPRRRPRRRSIEAAGAVLRGGAWIGALERGRGLRHLVAGWPEGVAIVLALKGLGRYPELAQPRTPTGAAERFIIGTFTSVLWAAACAGVVHLLRYADVPRPDRRWPGSPGGRRPRPRPRAPRRG